MQVIFKSYFECQNTIKYVNRESFSKQTCQSICRKPGPKGDRVQSQTLLYGDVIGNCRNVRGLGKSMVVFRFFEKLRYSNERSTKFESILPRIEVFREGKWQNGSSSNIT